MRRVVFSHEATADIESIWDYTADRWGRDQAERYILTIKQTCAALAQNEKAGRDASDIRAGYRKIRSGRHFLFYRETTDGAFEVVRILHERMDIPSQIEGERS